MNKIPKILLYADNYNDKVGVNAAYVNFFEQFGEVLLVTATNDLNFFLQHGDILALPGGADINPLRYGERPTRTLRINPNYEYLDEYLLMPWIETGKPIIGICRGLQTLNVALGGSLYQHVDGHVGGENRWKQDDELYTNIPGFKIHQINSYHHQAIKQLGNGLEMIGWSGVVPGCSSLHSHRKPPVKHLFKKEKNEVVYLTDKKGNPKLYHVIPEVIKHTTKPYVAFQYHPEEFNCELAFKLIKEIIFENENQEEHKSQAAAIVG